MNHLAGTILLHLIYSSLTQADTDLSQNSVQLQKSTRYNESLKRINGIHSPVEHPVRELEGTAEINPQIIGGGLVGNGDRYPYLGVMTNNFLTQFDHFCAGSLVAPDFILSAAHCAKYQMGEVGLGISDLWELLQNPRPSHINVYQLDEYYIHPDYDATELRNDIVLYKISEQVDSKYQPVKLNMDHDLPSTSSTNDVLTAMGFGFTSDQGSLSAQLRHVDIDPIQHDECYQQWYAATGYNYEISETSQLCCYTEGKATCNGDSGGPLIINGADASSDTQVGIVSFGSSLGCNHLPTVFTRISSNVAWIKSVVCSHSANPPAYMNCSGSSLEISSPNLNPTSSPTSLIPQNDTSSVTASPPQNSTSTETETNPPSSPENIDNTGTSQKTLIKLQVKFDEKPWETGWKLEKLHNDANKKTVIASADIGTYQVPNLLAWEFFPLDVNTYYRLTVTDESGDGLSTGNYFKVFVMIQDDLREAFEIQEFEYTATQRFYLNHTDSTSTIPVNTGKVVKNEKYQTSGSMKISYQSFSYGIFTLLSIILLS